MVPFLRTISVGGVFIAFLLGALALTPAGNSRMPLAEIGALMRHFDDHELPHWRRFVAEAAFIRAARSQDLRAFVPGAPKPPDARIAILRVNNVPGGTRAPRRTLSAAAEATIPVDIGEASSTELPLRPREEIPLPIRRPEPVEHAAPAERRALHRENPPVSELKPHRRSHHHFRHRRAKRATKPAHFSLLRALFGSHKDKRTRKTHTTTARN
jgi:hypothetical protein